MESIWSERHQAELLLGKKPARAVESSTVQYRDIRAKLNKAGLLPPVPDVFGHGGDFADWLMLGNGPCDDNSISPEWAAYQGAGDCWPAGMDHSWMEACKNSHRPQPDLTCLSALENYAAFTEWATPGEGYNLQSGANDSGSDVQQGLQYSQEVGFKDADGVNHTTGPVVAGTSGDVVELFEIAYLAETAGIGITIAQAQENQFNQDAPGMPWPVWDYEAGSPDVGGHFIIVAGRPIWVPTPYGRIVSWGLAIGFTMRFYEKQNDEVYGWCDMDRYRQVTGEDAEGFKDADVEKWLTMSAQAKAKAVGLI